MEVGVLSRSYADHKRSCMPQQHGAAAAEHLHVEASIRGSQTSRAASTSPRRFVQSKEGEGAEAEGADGNLSPRDMVYSTRQLGDSPSCTLWRRLDQ